MTYLVILVIVSEKTNTKGRKLSVSVSVCLSVCLSLYMYISSKQIQSPRNFRVLRPRVKVFAAVILGLLGVAGAKVVLINRSNKN